MAELNESKTDIPFFCNKHGLGGYSDRIKALEKQALEVFQSRSSMDKLGLGESRIGGIPDLPTEFSWPTIDDLPLEFLAQFDLAELQKYDSCSQLPQSGQLLFFYGFKVSQRFSRSLVRVIYLKNSLLQRPSESQIPAGIDRFHATKLSFRECLKMPHPGSWAVSELGLNEEEIQRYDLVYREWANHRPYGTSRTYLFGYPLIFNCPENPDDPPPKDIASKKGSDGYRCLFQIGGDEQSGIKIADLGLLRYFIHKDDLANAEFGDCWESIETT